jgi:hypothetical protein
MPAQHAAAAPAARRIALRNVSQAVQQIAIFAGDDSDGTLRATTAPEARSLRRSASALRSVESGPRPRIGLAVEERVDIGARTVLNRRRRPESRLAKSPTSAAMMMYRPFRQ